MRHYYYLLLTIVFGTVFYSCSQGQTNIESKDLSPEAFSKKIQQEPSALLLDVRTPDEFANGHLSNAHNLDWNGNSFGKQISVFDTSNTVLVYCLSGARSASAASFMRSAGFKNVYELKGGIAKWRSEGMPEVMDIASAEAGMSRQTYDSLLAANTLVLVNFYAEWCTPCKKMEPFLEELKADRKGQVEIIRLEVDRNPALVKALRIEVIPTLFIYRANKTIWKHEGFCGKEELMRQFR